ncbi:hypothetical protein XENOCAPTIV_021465 [Xenoophorus captivus]|uniref:SH3 domain-containing protein n=1 Tax=Xenoophorus captivus TaxID=1517983 RepID=A0ABV0QMJ2_9TELE
MEIYSVKTTFRVQLCKRPEERRRVSEQHKGVSQGLHIVPRRDIGVGSDSVCARHSSAHRIKSFESLSSQASLGRSSKLLQNQFRSLEEGGWWEGILNGKTGWFPSNYVREVKGSGRCHKIRHGDMGNNDVLIGNYVEDED